MKNFRHGKWAIFPLADFHFIRIFRIMKLTFIMIFAFTLFAKADGIAQRVTVSVHNEGIEEVFAQISRQTDYKFFYDAIIPGENSRITLNVKNEPIESVLKKALNNTPYEFKILSGTVLISSRKKHNAPETIRGQRQISGTVKDSEGNPLPGATIVLRNKPSVKAITNTDGKFTINASKGDVLLISYLGYKAAETVVGDETNLNIQLENLDKLLGEVVVVGYGTQRQSEISGSVTNLSEKDFNKGVTKNAVDLLRGKVAGLTITSGSGDVSTGETIRLRGTSSLTGSSAPFVVIDGVPGLNINSVAPQDIASISILKDASAGAIYGSRSAGGVILITTKKGNNNKPVINYDGYTALDVVSNKPKMLNGTQWRKYASDQKLDVSGLDMGANTDWFGEIMRKAISQNHSISLSGGGENSRYRASVNYLDRQGVVRGNEMQTLNSRLSFTQKALDNKLEITLTGALTQRDYSPTDGRNFVLAYNMIPVYPVKNPDGTWFDRRGYDEGNPLRNIEYNRRDNKGNMYYLNGQAKLEILTGLFGRVNALKERENNDYGSYNNSQTERGRDDQGFGSREFWTRDRNLIETTVEYVKSPLENHSLTILGGYSYENNHYQSARAQSRQFATDFFEYNNLGAGENVRAGDVASSANMNKLISFFGRVNYSIQERYILTAALRRDGSSKFGANHKWGTFPSVSAAWNIAKESFMKNAPVFEDLKLRAGYGVVGNQDGLNPYQTLQLYAPSGRYFDNGNWFQAYQISQNANPDLKWEETSMLNIGLDYSLFKGRINGVIEFYDKKTTDLLYMYQVPVPPYLYPTMIANVGTMSNRGIEFLINGNPIQTNNFSWNISLNMAHNKNEITRLSNSNFSTSSIKLGSAAVRGAATTTTHIIEEGKAVGTFYGWRNLGLDAAGKYIMDDMVDGKAGLTDNDRTYIGSAQPKLTYGINNSFTYKKLDLNFFLRGVYGNDVLNFSRMAYATTLWLPGGNALEEALANGLTDNPKYSSYNIEKGSFLRLDNASIGYNFDTQRIKHLKGLRLYVNAQNLFVITRYKGLDPEVDMSGLAPGMEGRDYYPKARTFSIGLNVTL
jgi:TonB-linked SusC/RagA family outer membrane protein